MTPGARGERDAGDVVRAGSRDHPAVEGVHVPDARQLDAEVGVVRQQRLPGGAPGGAHDPVVRADARVAQGGGARVEAGQRADPVADRRQAGEPGREPLVGRGGTQVGAVTAGPVPPPRRRRAERPRARWRRRAERRRPALTRSFVVVIVGAPGGIGRDEEVGQGRVAQARVGEEAEELGVVVAAERPGLELAEGDGVERRPRLGVVAAEAVALSRLEAGHHEGEPALAPALLEPGVDAGGVALQGADGRRVEGGQVALGGLPPAERPDEPVRVDLGLPEELADAAGADVAEDLHLPHPLGRVDEPLGEEEVVGGVGVEVGDPRLVADHLDGRREPGGPERPAHLRLRSARSPRRGGPRRRSRRRRRRRAPGPAGPPAGGGRSARDPSPPHRRATGRSRAVCPNGGPAATASAGQEHPDSSLRRHGQDRLGEDEVGQADAEVGDDDAPRRTGARWRRGSQRPARPSGPGSRRRGPRRDLPGTGPPRRRGRGQPRGQPRPRPTWRSRRRR